MCLNVVRLCIGMFICTVIEQTPLVADDSKVHSKVALDYYCLFTSIIVNK